MKDRFRFRVWYGAGNNDWIHDNDDYHVSIDLLLQDLCLKEWRSNGIEPSDFYDIPKEFATIEQCTGLNDKNGKLIYEGDIVRKDLKQDFKGDSTTPSYYCDCSCIGIVAFNASTGYFIKNAKVFLTLNKNEPKKLQDKILKRTRLCAKRCTVIGNFHENPELLER